jgi:hypothetical protein
MYDKTKAEAAAYAVEIELLTRALDRLEAHFAPTLPEERAELKRRLRVLLDLEESK